MSREPEKSERSRSPVAPRRPYIAPELVEYGNVAKLTQTGGMTTVDFIFNIRRMGM